jgi:hypothetical protein
MASGKGTYWANKLLDLVLGAAAFSAPASIFAGLYTSAANAGAGGTEASGGSYGKASLVNNLTNFPAAAGGVKTTATAFTFTTATANWSGGANMVAATLEDAASGGNRLYFGDLTVPKPVLNGDTAQFAAAAITITET